MEMLVLLLSAILCGACVTAQNVGDMEIVAEWVQVEYDWPSEAERNQSIANGTYIPENNVITGIKVTADGDIFVTVSRWLPGVPSTMNKLIFRDGRPLLQPFPSWEMQTIDDCSAFQFTQSMEIDNIGRMWIIDSGRRNHWLNETINKCPPKLYIINIQNSLIIHQYTFPNAVLSYTGNFVNDIVLDDNRDYAYMSDVGVSSGGHPGGIIAYDRSQNRAWRLEHPSMRPEVNRPDGGYDLNLNGKPYEMTVPSDGIALTSSKETVFYCSLGGIHLHQVAVDALLACEQDVCNLTDEQVRDMGPKVSESDGILWGQRSLYFAALGMNAIYRWDHQADMEDQNVSDLADVNMTSQVLVKKDDDRLIFCDTFALQSKWLYTTANRLVLFREGELDYTGAAGPNFRIARVYVDDVSYLHMPLSGTTLSFSLILLFVSLFITSFSNLKIF